eukprot:scaffold324358_cov43-Prasinocladus_malaysianus.AAC.1
MVFDEPNLAECWSPYHFSPATPGRSGPAEAALNDVSKRVVGFDGASWSGDPVVPVPPSPSDQGQTRRDSESDRELCQSLFVPSRCVPSSNGWKASFLEADLPSPAERAESGRASVPKQPEPTCSKTRPETSSYASGNTKNALGDLLHLSLWIRTSVPNIFGPKSNASDDEPMKTQTITPLRHVQ